MKNIDSEFVLVGINCLKISYWVNIENAVRFYKEHNADYLIECIENLRKKGIKLEL